MSEFDPRYKPTASMFGTTHKVPEGMGVLNYPLGLVEMYCIDRHKEVKLPTVDTKLLLVPVEDFLKIKNLLNQSLLLDTWMDESWDEVTDGKEETPHGVKDMIEGTIKKIDSIIAEAKQEKYHTVLF